MVENWTIQPLAFRRRQLLASQHHTNHADVHSDGAAPAMPLGARNPARRKLQRTHSGSVRALLWRSCDSSAVRATQSRQSKGAVSCRSSDGERATRYELAHPTQAR